MIRGQVISGELGRIAIRQKAGINLELGELLVSEVDDTKIIMQVFDLQYGSQISDKNLELISGLNMEEEGDMEFMDPHLRNYTIGLLKPLVSVSSSGLSLCKKLPHFFSSVRELVKEDLTFMKAPKNGLTIGNLRSGSKNLDFNIAMDGKEVFAHHILIPGTTGRGKSVLLKNILWDTLSEDYCGILVLDPHDEYYGRNEFGLKDHPSSKVVYYTSNNPPAGTKSLKINLNIIKPTHLDGVADFSDPQKQSMNMYQKEFGKHWIEAIIQERKLTVAFRDDTLAVVKRRLLYLLDLEYVQGKLACNGVFDLIAGESTVKDICSEIESSKTVVIDTSNFPSAVELLVGSLISTELFNHYKKYKINGVLKDKPVISIILEEAPRVLGKEVLEKGPNIFSTIAREGRKFQVGLTAITQLPSLIPRQILANMNTKIILGIEMKPERQAIIESASQDLSEDDRTIASLDKGEAIISSNFLKFATPVSIPFFDEKVKETNSVKKDFSGVNLS